MGFGKKVDILPSFFDLNPPGLQYSTDNKFVQRLKELQESAAVEKIPLIPTTPEEMSEMLQLCSYVRFKVPQQVLWPPQPRACLCPAQVARASFPATFPPCPQLSFIQQVPCLLCIQHCAWAPWGRNETEGQGEKQSVNKTDNFAL